MGDEAELLRLRAVDPPARPGRSTGARPWAGKVTSTGAALGVGKFVMMQRLYVFGREVEGGGAMLTIEDTPIPVYWIGPKTPATGDLAIVFGAPNRWVARKKAPGGGDTGGGASIPGCACTSIPTTLTMTTSGPCGSSTFQPCTITWVTTPPEFAGLGLGAKCFLSTASFSDPYTGTEFRYNLACNTVFFQLSRVYLATSSGGAYRDSTIYSWSIGLAGNTCVPFLLSNGFPVTGVDPGCLVNMSG